MIRAFINVFQGNNVFMLNPERKNETHTHTKRIVSTMRHEKFSKLMSLSFKKETTGPK